MRLSSRRTAWTALAVASVSLVLNAALLWSLRSPERWLAPVLLDALSRLEAEDARLRFEIRVPVGTPLSADVPLDERLSVRLNTELPIDTRIRLPIQSPLGSYTVSVPIRADLPIRTVVPVHIRHTLRLRSTVRQEVVLPIEVPVRSLPLEALRASLSP
ncbi:MAG: hypothetical protein M3409_12080 [Gemmatimonadota bacterium]|nr:hypothetical protein [Gemmatimonadota bacterium]